MTDQAPITTAFKANAHKSIQHVFIKDLQLMTTIGVYDHEKTSSQRIVANIDLTVHENKQIADKIEHVVCYHKVVQNIESITKNEDNSKHINLLETLAETIAEKCLEDKRILAIRVRLEKPEALKQAASVGVEIERLQAAN